MDEGVLLERPPERVHCECRRNSAKEENKSPHRVQIYGAILIWTFKKTGVDSRKHYCMLASVAVVAPGQGLGSTSAENNADCETLKNDPSATFIDGNCLGQQSAAECRARVPTSEGEQRGTGKLLLSAFHGSNKQKSD